MADVFANAPPPSKAGIDFPDMGDLFSGGIVSKAMDVLALPNYAAAGAVDYALEGQNPFAGAVEGLKTRESFIDVLDKRGAPKWLSIPVGLAADIAVPTVPGMGLLKGAKVSALARIAGVAERHGAMAIEDAIRIGAEGRAPAEAAAEGAAQTFMRGMNARDVFRATGDAEAARVAARAGEELGFVDHMKKLANADTPPSPSTAGAWLRAGQAITDRLVRSFGGFVESHPMFKGLGKPFVERMGVQGDIQRVLLGVGKERADEITRILKPEDHTNWWLAAQGLAEPANEDVAKAVQLTKLWTDENFAALSKRGARQTLPTATIAYRRMGADQKADVLRFLKELEAESGMVDPSLTLKSAYAQVGNRPVAQHRIDMLEMTGEGRLALDIFKSAGEITPGGIVKIPIRKVNAYLPAIKTAAAATRDSEAGLRDLATSIKRYGPELTPEQAYAAAGQILKERATEMGDIRKSLQHARGEQMTAEAANDFVHDPKQILYKMASDNADLISGAEAWGGKGELFDALRMDLARAHGLAGVGGADMLAPQAYREADETLTKAYAIRNGMWRDEMNPALRVLNTISDHIFLGPRTVLIQPTTLTNSGALSGVGNSFLAIQEAVTSGPIRRLVERLGAHIPTMLDAVDAARGLKKLSRWNPILNMVGKTDRGMRVTAAVAGGLHAAETEEKVLAAVRAGNMAKAEKMAGFLQRTHGIDTAGLLRGEALSDDAIMQAMTSSAHITNFTGDVLALPKAFQSTSGKFFLKFKQYALQQTHFIDRLANEALVHKNWGPLLRYAAMFPWVYHNVLRTVNTLKNQEKQNTPEDGINYLKDMLMIGALGYVGDVTQAMSSPSEALGLGFIAGPNAAAIVKGLQGTFAMLPGPNQDFSKAQESLIPQSVRQVKTFLENAQ